MNRFMNRFDELKKVARRLSFEPYAVDRPLSDQGQYQLELEPDFPFAIKLLDFSRHKTQPPLTWHTYLELFIPLSEKCRLQMGDSIVEISGGDVLVMDHLKLHALIDYPGTQARAIVIRFLPDFVRTLAPLASDHLLLLPFYCQIEGRPHILRGSDRAADQAHAALTQLLGCYFEADENLYWQTGSKAFFLEVLHHLARSFQASERLRAEYSRQQLRVGRLRELFKFINQNYGESISLSQAASIAGLSEPQFNTVFKEASGMTFVAYLTQVRLAHAAHLLKETHHSIADIASQVGFADQSYFDRRFRQHFGQTPLQFRQQSGSFAKPPLTPERRRLNAIEAGA